MNEAVDGPEDLYGVDLTDFVAERNALAARLKAAGDAEGAASVKALRKPPRTAWALNVVARERPDLVDGVLDAAAAVVASINDGGELRPAQAAYSRAVAALVDAAVDHAGLTGDALERVRASVLAAGADPDGAVAVALRAGVVTGDADAPGFTLAGVVPARTPRVRAVAAAPEADVDREEGTDVRADADAAEAKAKAKAKAAAAEEAAAAKAARAAQRRRARERQRLEQQIDRTAQRVGRLADAAAAAEAAAVQARAEADQARHELDDLRRQLDAVEGALD